MKVSGKTLLKMLVILLIVASLATTLGILSYNLSMRNNQLEGIYQRSYYETIDALNDIELSLSKLQISEDKSTQQSILNQLWGDSEVVETNLSTLMSSSPDNNSLISFVNKLGDYSKALSKKTSPMTDADKAIMAEMYTAIVTVKSALESVQEQIMDGNTLLSSVGDELNYLGDAFTNLSHASIAVPELIYDGPFSDGLNDNELKFVKNLTEISADEAKNIVESMLGKATYSSEIKEGIPSYIFQLNDYEDSEVRITKNGGKIYSLNRYIEVEDSLKTDEEYIAAGQQFLEKLGYTDMQAVWISNNNSTVYVNYAYYTNNVVCYPDIMIVKLTADTAEVIGLEGQNYIYNHIERNFSVPVSESVARAVLSKNLTIKSSRLALIPTEWNTEILTYEYVVEKDNQTYYIYIDALSPKEVNILRVIDDDGQLIA